MGDAGALKRKLRAARSAAGIESDQDLALRAGVHLQTLQNWMYGKTTPRPSELHKVARVIPRRTRVDRVRHPRRRRGER